MGLGRWWFCGWWTARELDDIDSEVGRVARQARRGQSELARRVAELERDLAGVALVARALGELCIRKSLLTKEEIEAMVKDIDIADGAEDGGLDPRMARVGSVKPPRKTEPMARKVPIGRARRRD